MLRVFDRRVGNIWQGRYVDTKTVLAEFGGDPGRYRQYVESGKGEKQISPFERAVASLVLGGESFVAHVRRRASRMGADLLKGRC